MIEAGRRRRSFFAAPVWGTLGSCLLLGLTSAAGGATAGQERSFWVWNRAESLTPAERDALQAAGVGRLYWQVGELELHGSDLALRCTALLPPVGAAGPAPEVIPVVRVSTSIRSPEQFSGEALGRALQPVAGAAPGHELQLDFDCPDRLLPVYAERLRTARAVAGIGRLTITALAGWANAAASEALWPAVDAVFPMLYDVETDPAPAAEAGSDRPGAPSACQPRPLLDLGVLDAELRSWQRCPIPWFAGLPVFSRITLYEPSGRSRGHPRRWDWEDLVFNPALLLDRTPANGTTVLRATRPTTVADSPVPTGGYVAVRAAELTALRGSIGAAAAAGARGVVFFRLPEPSGPEPVTDGGWSLAQLLALLKPPPEDAAPRLQLRHASAGTDRWILQNSSDADLPPRFGAAARGYGLEMELAGGAAGWRDALPGDFVRVNAHVLTGSPGAGIKPVAVPIPLARRLTFWFAELPAHGTLTTGLVQLAPDIDPANVRFRLPAADQPESTPWQAPD